MKYLNFLIVTLFAFYACGAGSRQTPEQQKEGETWDAVMAQHDVVMPLMGNTHTLRKQLKSYLKEQDTKEDSKITEAKNIITLLDKADESMMDWMQGFKKLGDLQSTRSHTEILQYLEDEDQKMKKVKELFDTSIQQGKDFLK